jgi:hypothetical protein
LDEKVLIVSFKGKFEKFSEAFAFVRNFAVSEALLSFVGGGENVRVFETSDALRLNGDGLRFCSTLGDNGLVNVD